MSLRNPGCAFCGMPPLDGEPCCTSDFKRNTMREADAELRDLRAYKERTEAGLQAWCGGIAAFLGVPVKVGEDAYAESLRRFSRNAIEDLKEAGLWRDPPQAEVQCRRLLDIIDHEKEPC